jgi:hypothetical protein
MMELSDATDGCSDFGFLPVVLLEKVRNRHVDGEWL